MTQCFWTRPVVKRALPLIALIAIVEVVAPSAALAYLDPGSLGYIVQLIVATFFAVLYTFWRRIRLFVAGLFARMRKSEGSGDA
jgi:hypothetical protein